jgi:glycosyltransferase involved in cell wall biosynthesis
MAEQLPVDVYHFLNGHYGGVYNVVRNLVLYTQNFHIRNHIVYVIEKERFPDWTINAIGGDCSELVFTYSRYENLNHVFKRLASKIPESAVLVAHDWFELGMVSHLGLPNPLLYMLHGNYDYYFNLFQCHQNEIDNTLCISKPSCKKLIESYSGIPNCHYFRFPVKDFKYFQKSFDKLEILVIAEHLNDPNKGVDLIREIDRLLQSHALPVKWHLVGHGFSNNELLKWWNSSVNIPEYHGYLTQDKLAEVLAEANVFLLPSQHEGVPVSLIEGMKSGLIPVVANWSDNVSDLVIHERTGYVLNDSSALTYANALSAIYSLNLKSQQLSSNASSLAARLFDPFKQVGEFESHALKIAGRRERIKRKIYGSRLDHIRIPNAVTIMLRRIKSICRFPFFPS